MADNRDFSALCILGFKAQKVLHTWAAFAIVCKLLNLSNATINRTARVRIFGRAIYFGILSFLFSLLPYSYPLMSNNLMRM